MTLRLLTTAFLLSGLVSGCGIKGGLATPPPVFGSAPASSDPAAPDISDIPPDSTVLDDDDDPFYDPDFEDQYGQND